MRSLIKVGALALTTVVASAAFVGCSSDSKKQTTGSVGSTNKDKGPEGGIGLNLQPVPGLQISQVHYSVTGGTGPGGAIPTVQGDLPTPGTASNFSFGVPLPVATGYQLSLTAESDATGDNITCTGGFGPFNITPNQSTSISLTLTCVDNTNGSVIGKVGVVTDACPTLKVNYAVATPHTANVGSSLQVLSLAADTNPAAVITYQWSVASAIGNFASATSKDTAFNCTAGGTDVAVTVTANNGSCSKKLSTTVSCANVTCGDGTFNPAIEACDNSGPPATDNPLCLPNCTLAVCGNGGAPETPVEQCEPPNTATCTGTCQTRAPNCGDTFVTPPEQCEPPNTASCSATCTTIAAAVCGDGQTTGSEVCDVPFSAANCGGLVGTLADATPACGPIETTACAAAMAAPSPCANFQCENLTGNAAAGPASGQPMARLCRALYDCILDTNCSEVPGGGGDNLRCYCGTAADCANPAQANGACKAQVEAAAESTGFITIGQNLGDPTFASGVATTRVSCARAAGNAAVCGVN